MRVKTLASGDDDNLEEYNLPESMPQPLHARANGVSFEYVHFQILVISLLISCFVLVN